MNEYIYYDSYDKTFIKQTEEGYSQDSFNGYRNYKTIQGRTISINKLNIRDFYKKVLCDESLLAAHITQKRFISEIPTPIGFFDIETTSDLKFEVGVVNDKVFTDPKEMIQYMKTFKTLISFNGWNFDLNLLNKIDYKSFKYFEYYGHKYYFLPGILHLDLLKFSWWHEPYSKKRSQQFLVQKYNLDEGQELLSVDAPLLDKCKQDIYFLKKLFEVMKPTILDIFRLVNMDRHMIQAYFGNIVRKNAFMEFYLDKGIILDQNKVTKENFECLGSYSYKQPGMYRDMVLWDIKRAYTNVLTKLNPHGVYEDGDYREYINRIYDKIDSDKLRKFLINAMNGDMHNEKNLMRNEDIHNFVVNFTHTFVKLQREKTNAVYSQTDSLMLPQGDNIIPEDNYIFFWQKAEEFSIVKITKKGVLVGITQNGELKKKFTNIPMIREFWKFWEQAIPMVDFLLKSLELQDIPEDQLQLIVDGVEPDAFKVVVYKKDEICRNDFHMSIWNELEIGFNDCYVDENFDLTLDPQKTDKKIYLNLLKEYVNQFND